LEKRGKQGVATGYTRLHGRVIRASIFRMIKEWQRPYQVRQVLKAIERLEEEGNVEK
jgi:hypothetical protein